MNGEKNRIIKFEINKYAWVLLFRGFGNLGSKLILRSESITKQKRVKDESDHEMDQVETEGSTKIRPKYAWDITKFPYTS